MKVTKPPRFLAGGLTAPERYKLKADLKQSLSSQPAGITLSALPLASRIEVKAVRPEALLIKKEEGRARTIALIADNIGSEGKLTADIQLALGDLKGFGKLNMIYGQKIVDWLKSKVFSSVSGQGQKIGFMYLIYGDEIGITSHPGINPEEIRSFLPSLLPSLEAELSGHVVATLTNLSDRSRELLEADERVKVLGGYFGVDLMVFAAREEEPGQVLKNIIEKVNQAVGREEDLRAELYDPDFNQARVWAPKIQFAVQSVNELLDRENALAADPDKLYEEAKRSMIAALKPVKEKKNAPQAKTILLSGAQETLGQQPTVLNKADLIRSVEGMIGQGKKVLVGRIKVNPYQHQGQRFTAFKGLNDHFGSQIGDEAIKLLSYALSAGFSSPLILARDRVPPDEFIFLADASARGHALLEINERLTAAQSLVAELSELKVAFEVSLVDGEEVGDQKAVLTTLDKVSRAKENVLKMAFPSGNRINSFNRDLADQLDQEIKGLERATARQAEASLSAAK